MSDKPYAVVVDGYSAGNFYPAAFAELDARVIHVQGTPELMTTMLAPNLAEYDDNIVHTDLQSTIDRLAAYAPACILPGQESAVPLADQLSEAMGLPSNGTLLSAARRDKYEMIEVLRRAGIRCAEQFKSGDARQLMLWAREHGKFPVVVKPLSSGGTDGVYICHDVGDVRAAADTVLSTPDIFGLPNREALIQSYLSGTEYIVDTVSCDGQRYACGVWEYEKSLLPDGRNIYDKDILLDPEVAPVPTLVAYVDEVLRALNIRWGAAHAEVIMTPDGPALVEIGARLNGNMNPGFHDVCMGHNQAALTVQALLQPAEFKRRYGNRVYPRLQPAMVYNAPTTLDGIVGSINEQAVAEIAGLPSVHLSVVKIKPGGRVKRTVDLMTTPIRVFLTAPSADQIAADYEKVRQLKDLVYLMEDHSA